MIDIDRMLACELSFPEKFTNFLDRPYGRLFHNADNPRSNDSNHAIIFRLDADLDEALTDVTAFYQGMGLKPRSYPAFLPGEVDILKPALLRHGYTFDQFEDHHFYLRDPSSIKPNPALEVTRIRVLDATTEALLCNTEGSDRTVRILRRHLQYDSLHCLVGYVDSRAVTMGSFEVLDGLSRVDNVMTHPECRNHGYSRALIHHMVQQYPLASDLPLYLWATNPVAIRIYREAGFVEFTFDRPAWGAWRD